MNITKVLGPAQQVIELEEKSEEEIILVEEEVSENKTILASLLKSNQQSKDVIENDVSEIQHLKNIKEVLHNSNVTFLTKAHTVYKAAIEFEEKFDEKDKMIDKILQAKRNEDRYKTMIKECNKMKNEFLTFIKSQKDKKGQEEQEIMQLNEESIQINDELSEILQCMKYMEEEIIQSKQTYQQDQNDLKQLKEKNQIIDSDIETAETDLRLNEKEKNDEYEKCLTKLNQLEKTETELDQNLQSLSSKVESNESENLKLEKEIKEEENINILQVISDLTHKSENLDKELEESATMFSNNEEKLKETIEKLQNETYYQNRYEKLTENINVLETDTEKLELSIEMKTTEINDMESKRNVDSTKQYEEKQDFLKKIKSEYKDLKEKFNTLLTEEKTYTQNEISQLQNQNQDLKLYVEKMEKEILDMTTTNEENEKREEELRKIVEERRSKNEQSSNSQQQPNNFKQQPQLENIFKTEKLVRNWDSDTTVEDEDINFSERLLKRMKRKQQSNKK